MNQLMKGFHDHKSCDWVSCLVMSCRVVAFLLTLFCDGDGGLTSKGLGRFCDVVDTPAVSFQVLFPLLRARSTLLPAFLAALPFLPCAILRVLIHSDRLP